MNNKFSVKIITLFIKLLDKRQKIITYIKTNLINKKQIRYKRYNFNVQKEDVQFVHSLKKKISVLKLLL